MNNISIPHTDSDLSITPSIKEITHLDGELAPCKVNRLKSCQVALGRFKAGWPKQYFKERYELTDKEVKVLFAAFWKTYELDKISALLLDKVALKRYEMGWPNWSIRGIYALSHYETLALCNAFFRKTGLPQAPGERRRLHKSNKDAALDK